MPSTALMEPVGLLSSHVKHRLCSSSSSVTSAASEFQRGFSSDRFHFVCRQNDTLGQNQKQKVHLFRIICRSSPMSSNTPMMFSKAYFGPLFFTFFFNIQK